MRKIAYCICYILALATMLSAQVQNNMQSQSMSQFYQNKQTVTELQTERDISQRLEDMLYPFVGKVTALVDVELEYPPLKIFGSSFDKAQSLPGLPVSRSTGVLPDKMGDETLLPTYITKKKITIILNKDVNKNDEQFARDLILRWFPINQQSGDELSFVRSQKKMNDAAVNGGSNFKLWPVLLVIGAIFVIFFFLLSSKITSGFRYLIRSMEIMNKQSSSVLSNMFGMAPAAKTQSDALSKLQISQKKPLPITIVENDNNNGESDETNLDFNFVEEIPPEQFAKLIQNESPEVVALLVQKLPPKYSAEFLGQFPHLSLAVIKQILNPNADQLPSLPGLREKLKKRIKMIKNENLYKVDATKLLTNIIKESPPGSATNLIQIIGNIDPGKQNEIRKKVFLLDDIVKLDDKIIEGFIRGVNHDQLVKFLVSVKDDIRQKFFRNMTPRAVSIIKEDIEIMGDLTPDERTEATKEMLNLFRTVLNA